MSQTFNEYIAMVTVLMKVGQSLEDAIRTSEAPLQLQEQIREYIRGPVRIDPPDLLIRSQPIRLCEAFNETTPQPYWNAFRAFLQTERRWQRGAIERLAETSETLVCRLPQPATGHAFQIRGLVVGYIQSGKTATIASIIARAADQGYRLFIVLAGLMKDLRAQTQRRLDQEITGGTDDRAKDSPLVIHDNGVARWVRLTRSGLDGDFQPGTVQMDLNPQTPKLVVLKKIPAVLARLTRWLQTSPIPLSQLPVLVIDDEADHASIDTNYGRVDENGDPVDPTRTNACIRELLQVLPKCVYVGFTATPFANVLIDMTIEQDLYPRDFIASLPEPAEYFGPRQLFGLGMTPSDLTDELPEQAPIDVIRMIEHDQLDALEQLTPGTECPEILSRTLLTWLLSCCARLARGQEREHFTMLVHPSQLTADHRTFAAVLAGEVEFLRAVTARPRNFPDLLSRARDLWQQDFVPVTESQAAAGGVVCEFDTIWRFARSVAESIEVKVLNYGSDDQLDYTDPPKRYVVVGGNRLSRGLTLEGLSVSVFTRNANTYDTVMQMGRWFGFRPGYHDLTRIFVDEVMAGQFADLARVELELRSDLHKYARQPDPPTPAELAPRIRAHPSMAVTSRMKMGAGRPIRISFQNTTQNTVNFPTGNRAALEGNIDAARVFLGRLGRPAVSLSSEGMHIWKDVPSAHILEFLGSYVFGAGATAVNRASISAYIKQQNTLGALRRWGIAVPRGNPNRAPFYWTDEVFGRRVIRTPSSPTSIGVLSSPNDLEQWRRHALRSGDGPDVACLMFYLIDKESGEPGRALFSAAGADLLGLVFQFPASPTNVLVDYVSQHDQ